VVTKAPLVENGEDGEAMLERN